MINGYIYVSMWASLWGCFFVREMFGISQSCASSFLWCSSSPLQLPSIVLRKNDGPAENAAIEAAGEEIAVQQRLLRPRYRRHHPSVALPTGPWQSGDSLPVQIEQSDLSIVMRYGDNSTSGDRQTIDRGIRSNGGQGGSHVAQLPDLDCTII